jgi:hypothetical protein
METVPMVDVLPTENFAIDPPLETSEAPLVGNPILTRRSVPGRSKYLGWYVGVPLAVIAVCGAAYAVVAGQHQTPLVATSATTEQASTATVTPAPTPAPVAAPAPAPMAQATPEPAMAPVQPPARLVREARADERASHWAAERRAAATAEDSGSDASATSPNAATPPPAAPMTAPPSSTPAPTQAAPAPEAAPPVITPPPS